MSPGFQDLAEAAGRVAVAFQAAPQGVPKRVWAQLNPWLRQLVLNATGKWLPRVTANVPCQVPVYRQRAPIGPCQNNAVALCDVCGRMTCLDHCRVDQFGDAICYLCIMEAMQRRDAAGETPPPNRGQPPWEREEEHEHHAHAPPGAPSQADQAAVRAAYRMLGVRQAATDEELKAALKAKLARWHPDKFKSESRKQQAEEKFKQIQAAYEVIQRFRARTRAAA